MTMTKFTRIALSSTAGVALLAGASALSANAAPLGANLESAERHILGRRTLADAPGEYVRVRSG